MLLRFTLVYKACFYSKNKKNDYFSLLSGNFKQDLVRYMYIKYSTSGYRYEVFMYVLKKNTQNGDVEPLCKDTGFFHIVILNYVLYNVEGVFDRLFNEIQHNCTNTRVLEQVQGILLLMGGWGMFF